LDIRKPGKAFYNGKRQNHPRRQPGEEREYPLPSPIVDPGPNNRKRKWGIGKHTERKSWRIGVVE
jgi:hypothetical protein